MKKKKNIENYWRSIIKDKMETKEELKSFDIEGYSDRKFYAKVYARNKEEALKKALNGEWDDEETENEDFHDINLIDEEEI